MTRSVGPLTFRSHLTATPQEVWAHATSMTGVNLELGPWLRMSHPPGAERLGPDARCLVLLAGIVPIDVHLLHFDRIEAERGFSERSRTLIEREWHHQRALEPSGDGTVVTDTVRFRPRFVLLAPALRAVVIATFAHRHVRLRERFGGRRDPPARRARRA